MTPVGKPAEAVELDREVGALMRGWRETAGNSLRDEARRLDISASYLSDIERGNRKASELVVAHYARRYEVPVSFLQMAAGNVSLVERRKWIGKLAVRAQWPTL